MAPKLTPHAITRFWDVHAWSGVVAGLVLYIMFLAGAATRVHEELALWQEPLAQSAPRVKEALQPMLERAPHVVWSLGWLSANRPRVG